MSDPQEVGVVEIDALPSEQPAALVVQPAGAAVTESAAASPLAAQRSVASSMGDLLFMAVERGTSVEELKQLVALHDQIDRRQAERDFALAMASFQAECPSIRKVKQAKFATRSGGEMQYTYAPLEEIAKTINPILAKYGLSYTWDETVTGNMIAVVCTVRHVNGHQATASITLPTENSNGALSAQQKLGASLTFGRRLSLTSALGITTADEDRDGRDDNVKRITEEQADTIAALAEEVKVNVQQFFKWLGVNTYAEIPAARYKQAVRELEKRRSKTP